MLVKMFAGVSQVMLLLAAFIIYQSIDVCSPVRDARQRIRGGPPIIEWHQLGKNRDGQNNLQFVNVYERVEMICIPDRNATCEWMKDGSPYRPNPNRVDKLPSRIPGASNQAVTVYFDTAGSYQCVCRNQYGVAVSPTTRLQLAALDAFPIPSNIPVHQLKEGAPLRLNCNPPRSVPKKDVDWVFSEIPPGKEYDTIDLSKRIQQDYQGNLYFANVLVSDNYQGLKYECRVYNSALKSTVQGNEQILDVSKSATEAAKLAYQEPVLQWSTPRNDVAVAGATKAMKCIFSGLPTPDVTWSRVDPPLAASRAEVTKDGYGTEIRIEKLISSDTGVYRCTATTPASAKPVSVDFNLTVEAPPSWMANFPERRREVIEGTPTEFRCPAEGIPTPTMHWTINGRPVVESERVKIENGILKYSYVIENDTEVIQCTAANTHGEILTNFALTVLAEPPTFTTIPPANIDVKEGSDVNLTCRADGIPSPNITWNKGSEVLYTHPPRLYIRSPGNLMIKNASVDDTGHYRCEARNKFGHQEHAVHLRVMGIPAPVTDVQMLERSPRTIKLAWTKPANNNAEIRNYTIYYRNKRLGINNNVTIGTINQTEVSGTIPTRVTLPVKPWTDYDIHIVARNDIGSSQLERTSVVTFSSQQDVPERNPRGICTVSRTSGGLYITWEALKIWEANGEGFYYAVTYRVDGDVAVSRTVNVTGFNSSELWLRDEILFNRYIISVQAGNSVGLTRLPDLDLVTGYSSDTVPEEVPRDLRVIPESVNITSAEISWKSLQMNSSKINGLFKGYRVQYWMADRPDARIDKDIIYHSPVNSCEASNFSLFLDEYNLYGDEIEVYQITDLWSGVTVKAAVCVLNLLHCGPWSDVIGFKTLQDPESLEGGAVVAFSNPTTIGLIVGLIFILLLIILIVFLIRCRTGEVYPVQDKEKQWRAKYGKLPNGVASITGLNHYSETPGNANNRTTNGDGMQLHLLSGIRGNGFQTSTSSGSGGTQSDEAYDTDSLGTYYDYDTGQFNEDGSFIGVYRNSIHQ